MQLLMIWTFDYAHFFQKWNCLGPFLVLKTCNERCPHFQLPGHHVLWKRFRQHACMVLLIYKLLVPVIVCLLSIIALIITFSFVETADKSITKCELSKRRSDKRFEEVSFIGSNTKKSSWLTCHVVKIIFTSMATHVCGYPPKKMRKQSMLCCLQQHQDTGSKIKKILIFYNRTFTFDTNL